MDDGGDFAVGGFAVHRGFEVGTMRQQVVVDGFFHAAVDFKLFHQAFLSVYALT